MNYVLFILCSSAKVSTKCSFSDIFKLNISFKSVSIVFKFKLLLLIILLLFYYWEQTNLYRNIIEICHKYPILNLEADRLPYIHLLFYFYELYQTRLMCERNLEQC